jgi:hypothetical protein
MQDVGSQVTFKGPRNWGYLTKRPSSRQSVKGLTKDTMISGSRVLQLYRRLKNVHNYCHMCTISCIWSTTLMFCWPCIIVYQYIETNVIHFLFNLLRIKGLYMFWALLAHPQKALPKHHLVYCVRVMSAGWPRTKVPLHSWCSQLT